MKRPLVACLFAVPMLSCKLLALTDIGWDPAGNPSQDGLFSTAANWNPNGVPTDGYKAKFFVGPAVPCVVGFTTGNAQIVIGDGGPGIIVVTNGGILNAGALVNQDGDGWTAIGYSADAQLTIENGATAHFNYHLWIGLTDSGHGTFIMNGGTATVSAASG